MLSVSYVSYFNAQNNTKPAPAVRTELLLYIELAVVSLRCFHYKSLSQMRYQHF